MRISCLAVLLACLGLTSVSRAGVTYSASSGQGDASYTISTIDPGPGDFGPLSGDSFTTMSDFYTDHQTIYLPTPPFTWWTDSANAPLDSNVFAHASMYATFESLQFTGGGYSGCQADSADSMAIASTNVDFDFTLDQPHTYVLSCTIQRSGELQFSQMTITDALFNIVASNTFDSGTGPQVLDTTGTLAAGTYHFSAMTTANYGGGEQTAQVDYNMTFTEIPEPASVTFLLAGTLTLAFKRRR